MASQKGNFTRFLGNGKAGNTQQKHVFELRTEEQNKKYILQKKEVDGKYSKQSLDDGKKIDEKVLQINI